MGVVSGSEGTFVPSSYTKFDQAVALGTAAPGSSRSIFMTYDQALQKGAADLAAQSRTAADAAREYQKYKGQPGQAQAAGPATPGQQGQAQAAASAKPQPQGQAAAPAKSVQQGQGQAAAPAKSVQRKRAESAQDIVNRILRQ